MSLSVFFAAVSALLIAVVYIAYCVLMHAHFKQYAKLAKTSTFYCLKCDSVYVSRTGEKSKNCPKCGYKNAQMKF